MPETTRSLSKDLDETIGSLRKIRTSMHRECSMYSSLKFPENGLCKSKNT